MLSEGVLFVVVSLYSEHSILIILLVVVLLVAVTAYYEQITKQ